MKQLFSLRTCMELAHRNIGKCGTLIDFMVELIANKLNMELKIEKN